LQQQWQLGAEFGSEIRSYIDQTTEAINSKINLEVLVREDDESMD